MMMEAVVACRRGMSWRPSMLVCCTMHHLSGGQEKSLVDEEPQARQFEHFSIFPVFFVF
jgi:hypothetical protein